MAEVSRDVAASLVNRLRAAGCVFAEDEAALLIAQAQSEPELEELASRRISGEPLEVVLGWAEFCGLRVEIDPGVFVPRRKTEFLVAVAMKLARSRPTVVDLCCGSGAIGLAVAASVADTELWAVDIEPAAVACAARNLIGVGTVFEGDLFDPLPHFLAGAVDLLLVNAPYVPTAEIPWMPPEARDYEPRIALDGGKDGLEIHRRVAAAAPTWLRAGGSLLIEVSELQEHTALKIFTDAGLKASGAFSDDDGCTVVIGTKPID